MLRSPGGSCTMFSSGGGDVAVGHAHGAAPPVVSRGSIQSLPHSAQASTNTTIRVGWKRRYLVDFFRWCLRGVLADSHSHVQLGTSRLPGFIFCSHLKIWLDRLSRV